MPAKIYLLRHGETESNVARIYQGRGDSPLTQNGIMMTEELAEYLKGLDFKGIYCSDLSRGVETAKIIAKFHQVSPTLLPDLRERNYGVWEGLTFKEIAERYGDVYETWQHNPAEANIAEAETLEELQARALRALAVILEKHPGQEGNICIVGHGGVNRSIMFHYLGLDLNSFWKVRQSNCCVNVIEHNRHRKMVSLMNSTCFLKKSKVNRIPIY